MNVDAVRAYGPEIVAIRNELVMARPRARTAPVDRSVELIEELYREEAPRFRRVALAIVHNPETAEDVVQEAFARALLRRRSFRGSGAASGWLWRIVVNTALSRRRRWRLEAETPVLPDAGVSRTLDVEFQTKRLRDDVARLPERQKLALFLRYYADLDYEAIAHVLSVAPGTVGKLLHDARATVRRAVEKESDG